MRISWLSVSDQLGGSETALLGFLSALRQAQPGWQLQVILPGEGPLLPRVAALGATPAVVPMPASLSRLGESRAVRSGWTALSTLRLGADLARCIPGFPAYERRVGAELDSFEAEVVHTNGLKAHVVGARLAGPARSLVWHLHEYVSPRQVTMRLLRHYAPRTAAIIANSRSVAEDATRALEPASPISVVYNPVDLDTFSPHGPAADLDRLSGSAPVDALRVGLVGTFGRWKGHDVFVAAMRRVMDRTSQRVCGYIVGDAVYDTSGSQYTRGEIESMLAAHDLAGRVRLTGFVDAASAMRALDIVVHASTEPEPFGLVVAEAMASGRAVVTSGRGGTRELIEDGVTAVVAESGDVEALANSILGLVEDASFRRRLGANARAAALEQFSPLRTVSELVRIYQRVAPRVPA